MLDASNLPAGWNIIDNPDQQALFEVELYGEVAPSHPLFGVKVRTVARRESGDAFLFEILGPPIQLTVVHLTWVYARNGHEDTPPWPATQIFPTVDDWMQSMSDDAVVDSYDV
ncbi:hypothetical protein [Deinococcus navajonensis]|uniref:Uncharacterized protein n=1 Tax=Deinococcus navajonensis TaxID=309884 RepID=A0ABV8XI79_9DEIO